MAGDQAGELGGVGMSECGIIFTLNVTIVDTVTGQSPKYRSAASPSIHVMSTGANAGAGSATLGEVSRWTVSRVSSRVIVDSSLS